LIASGELFVLDFVVPRSGDANASAQLCLNNVGTMLALFEATTLVLTVFFYESLMDAQRRFPE